MRLYAISPYKPIVIEIRMPHGTLRRRFFIFLLVLPTLIYQIICRIRLGSGWVLSDCWVGIFGPHRPVTWLGQIEFGFVCVIFTLDRVSGFG
jgi:hypothetical protein